MRQPVQSLEASQSGSGNLQEVPKLKFILKKPSIPNEKLVNRGSKFCLRFDLIGQIRAQWCSVALYWAVQ